MNSLEGGRGERVSDAVVHPGLPVDKDGVDLMSEG